MWGQQDMRRVTLRAGNVPDCITRADMEQFLHRYRPQSAAILIAPLVIHRTYRPYDSALHKYTTAAQFVEQNMVFSGSNVLVQVYNEPGTYDAEFAKVIKFCCEVYDLGTPRGLRFAFVNQAVGHVAEYNIPLCDPLLKRLAGYVPGSIWGVHEYATYAGDRPYRIGRFEMIANRVRQLGLAPVQFGVTEYGRDEHGGFNDGYKWHMTSLQYGKFLQDGMPAYRPFNAPTAVFCYGPGYGWNNFNVEGDNVVLAMIDEYGRRYPAQALIRGRPVMPALTDGTITAMPGTYVNVRNVPLLSGSSVIGVAYKNSRVRWRVFGDWFYVHTPEGARGYISRQITAYGPQVRVG